MAEIQNQNPARRRGWKNPRAVALKNPGAGKDVAREGERKPPRVERARRRRSDSRVRGLGTDKPRRSRAAPGSRPGGPPKNPRRVAAPGEERRYRGGKPPAGPPSTPRRGLCHGEKAAHAAHFARRTRPAWRWATFSRRNFRRPDFPSFLIERARDRARLR